MTWPCGQVACRAAEKPEGSFQEYRNHMFREIKRNESDTVVVGCSSRFNHFGLDQHDFEFMKRWKSLISSQFLQGYEQSKAENQKTKNEPFLLLA